MDTSCPVDRIPLTVAELIPPPRILVALLDELKVVCYLGCGWEGNRAEWPAHLERYCTDPLAQGLDQVACKGKAKAPMRENSAGDVLGLKLKSLMGQVNRLKEQALLDSQTIGLLQEQVSKVSDKLSIHSRLL